MASGKDTDRLRSRIDSIYRANPAGMGVVVERVLVEANAKLCQMTGYAEAELIGKDVRFLYFSDEEYQRVGARGLAQIERHGTMTVETRWRRRDGTSFDVLISSSPIQPGRPAEGNLFTALDITERKAAEKALRAHEETLHALLNATPDLAFLVDEDGNVLACNEAFARRAGARAAEELAGTSIWNVPGLPLDHRAREEAQRVRRSAAAATLEISRDSSVYELVIFPIPDASGKVQRLAFFLRDVTASRQNEEELRQSQKMEAVGRLAGGIAHDFNNLITVIRGFAELALEAQPRDSRLSGDIAQVKAAADRAAELTARLLAFSRKQVLTPRVVEPAVLVRGIETMLRRVIGEDIDVTVDLAADTGRIMADPGQVEQVMLNLAVNARDAMPRGGTLAISACNQPVSVRGDPEFPGLAAGDYVRLRVSDTGHGMDRATMSRIFEPFFTTKEPGKGTGMGLSTVYGIVTQSGGRIFCTSAPGQGTAFTMFFPRLLGPVSEPERVEKGRQAAGGTERVLLVEDEVPVRTYARRVLENGGYEVLEAGSGEGALRIAETERGPIDLLLTDVVMPGMGGSELSSRMTGLRPEIRTLYMSGYGRPALERRGALSEGSPLLGKPFDELGLLSAVRAALGA